MIEEYFNWPCFTHIYLEDSFVLEIIKTKNRLSFIMDFVLLENHSNYEKPKINEQYCYKKGALNFDNVSILNCEANSFFNGYTDANNEKDYGNIDVLYKENEVYKIFGDWGEAQVVCDFISIEFE